MNTQEKKAAIAKILGLNPAGIKALDIHMDIGPIIEVSVTYMAHDDAPEIVDVSTLASTCRHYVR